MGLFGFFANGQQKNNAQIEEQYFIKSDSIIPCNNINFNTKNKNIITRLKATFDEKSDYFSIGEERILCQIPTFAFGNFLLSHKLEVVNDSIDINIKEYSEKVLYKNTEIWKRVEDKPTRVFYESINPKQLIPFLDFVIKSKTDSTNYVWSLESEFHHPEDNYNGVYCKFTTSHTNPKWDWEFNSEKKDFCKVSERYKDEAIEWIPLEEGKIIKGDRISLTARKIYIDEKMKEMAVVLKKACLIAIEFELELSKDNDG